MGAVWRTARSSGGVGVLVRGPAVAMVGAMHTPSFHNCAKPHGRTRSVVGDRPPSARPVFHVAFAAVVALAAWATLGPSLLPAATASAQTLSPEESAPAVVLEARSEDGASAPLPLLAERLNVRIDDEHATASYEHVFQNESNARLEGNYRLAVGEGATATGFAYYNGDEKIVGEIFEREAARQVYDALTGLRRDPGLLEQSGEGGCSFHVFPIEPGEKKRVQVTTSRWLPRRGGLVEYRARLSRADANVVLSLRDVRGIRSLESSSHELRTERAADGTWTATVLKAKTAVSDELVVEYEPAESPLVLHASVHHDPGEEAFFMATLATPAMPENHVRTGIDVTLVLDRSGSMQGPSIESARAAAKAIVERLTPSDRVNVVVFDNEVASLYTEPRPLTDAIRREALAYIAKIQAGGGTNIARALAKALASQVVDDHPDVVLFLTDGQSDGPSAIKVASEDRGGARVFTVGMGDGVDKSLLSRIAAIKHGRFTFIADTRAVAAEFPKVLSQLEEPVVTDVTLRVEGGGSVERVYPATFGDLFASDELRVFGRTPSARPFKLVVEGKVAGVSSRFETTVDPSGAVRAPWVARGWAHARVDDLLEELSARGENEELKNEAIELGLAYDLVTPFTSFLAVPASAMTEDAEEQIRSMRDRRKRILAARTDAATLSRLNMPPGDPVLSVQAPRDARRVTAMFPFGLVQDLAYDDMTERWTTRFLVPKDVADGTYDVRVIVALRDGSVTATIVHYTIDSRDARIDVDAKGAVGGAEVRVQSDEPLLEVRLVPDVAPSALTEATGALDDVRGARSLVAGPDRRTFAGHLPLAPGHHRIRVVAADLARNETVREVEVEVPRRPGGAEVRP